MPRVNTSVGMATIVALAGAARGDGGVHEDWCRHGCEAAKLAAWQGSAQGTAHAGFDEATGRDTSVYPPDRVVDALHMRLELTIPDMETRRALGVQTLTIAPIGTALREWTLDATGLQIASVACEKYTTTFRHDGKRLTITFDPPVPAGERVSVVTTYAIDNPMRGMIWTPSSSAWPGRAAQLHTQGQAQTNNFWFPCHDFPNERLTTELFVTVPAGYEVISNGELRSRRVSTRDDGSFGAINAARSVETFHWVQDAPHVNYLVSLVVGKFDVVDVGDRRVAMPVFVPPGRGKDVRATYGRTLAMLRHFEMVLDEPYPWHQYAQTLAFNFEAGGMENTGASTMFETALYSPSALIDHDLDGLISHELAHQWFGDLITCNSWEHIWLNEGFATFMTAEWFRARDGDAGYFREVMNNFDRVSDADTGAAPASAGMASKVYRNPWETFRRPANPYPKGASILHMLREKLGEELFWKCMQRYVDRHHQQTVETDELRRVFEEVSGRELEQFFRQWTQRPGIPSVDVTPTFDASRATLRIDVRQTQPIDEHNPAFEFDLPMLIRTAGGPDVRVMPQVTAKQAAFEVQLEAPPIFVAVNDRVQVLARMTTKQTPEAWLQQLATGPTLVSRVMAARGLASLTLSVDEERAVRESLRRVAVSSQFPAFVREEAIKALRTRDATPDLRSLATMHDLPWEVRRTLFDALGSLASQEQGEDASASREAIARLLASAATGDQSLKARCSALRALALVDMAQAQPLLESALETSSQSDQLRQAAIGAIVANKPANALTLLVPCTRPGIDGRTRVAALDGVAALGTQDVDLALRTLEAALLGDEHRPRMAAARGLVLLGDPRGVAMLDKAIEAWHVDEVADALREQRAALAKKLSGNP